MEVNIISTPKRKIYIISQDLSFACEIKAMIYTCCNAYEYKTLVFENLDYACENLEMENFIDLIVIDSCGMALNKTPLSISEARIDNILIIQKKNCPTRPINIDSKVQIINKDDYSCIENAIQSTMENYHSKDLAQVTLCSNNRILRLTQSDIIALEKIEKTVLIYTKSKTIKIRGSLKDIHSKLNNNFIRVHQGYVVNLNCILKYEKRSLEMEGLKSFIPVSRRSVPTLKDYLMS